MKALIETLRIFVIFAILTAGIFQLAMLITVESPNNSGIEL